MDKVLLRTVRLCASRLAQRQHVTHFSKSSCLGKSTGTALDDDPSWEAAVLRHEKRLDELKSKGVKPEDLPDLDREEKVKNLPHISFVDESTFAKNESILDETSRLLLGNAKPWKPTNVKSHSNLDHEFYREDVQELLQQIHYSYDLRKVYKHHVTKRKVMPSIKYLTDEQLQQKMKEINEEVIEKLKMPLVMLERPPCSGVLSEDPVLDGHDESNISFTDISEGLSNRERFIVIREPNGVLRKAEWEERDRLLQTYYPVPHRKVVAPSFFNKETIGHIFTQKLHENALDQCIVQFEADSKEYLDCFQAVYSDIHKQGLYDSLRSTRYFGGLVYFLAKKKRLDGILLYFLNEYQLENASACVRLYSLLHHKSSTKKNAEGLQQDCHDLIVQAYIDGDSSDRKRLSIALQQNAPADESVSE